MPTGKLPTSISCTTVLVSGSIRETVLSRLLTTHTAPLPVVIPLGLLPTGIVWTTAFRDGSIRMTVWSSAFDTQYEPSPTARCVGVAATPASARGRAERGP